MFFPGFWYNASMDSVAVKSQTQYELIDVTREVAEVISKSAVKSGTVLVFVPHATAGIVCNENEAHLKTDILKVMKAVDEHSDFFGGFDHDRDEGNAHAHITAALSGSSRSFVIEGGRLQLGTWQSIMFLEMDGPREREIWIQVINSKSQAPNPK